MIALPAPYLLFLGDATEADYAKTAFGLRDWARDLCVGEFACADATVTTGLPRLTPCEAYARGARSLVIGVANVGGVLKQNWIPSLLAALEAGLDLVSGMHGRLNESRELKATAERLGRRLIDIRQPPPGIPVGTGRKRSGKRLLTVGTDCALGKKYTALALTAAFRRRRVNADFRASGQTGIMIAGSGLPMDAVVSDFVAGAAELLSPDAPPGHWDVIEGQGSLFHPAYAGVSLGDHFMKLNDIPKAVAGYKIAADNANPAELSLQARFKVAEIYFNQKDYEDAAQYYQKVFETAPSDENSAAQDSKRESLKGRALLGLFYCDLYREDLDGAKRRYAAQQPAVASSAFKPEPLIIGVLSPGN